MESNSVWPSFGQTLLGFYFCISKRDVYNMKKMWIVFT